MYNELVNDRIIVEIRNLVDEAEKIKDDMDLYCEFMRDRLLGLSGAN